MITESQLKTAMKGISKDNIVKYLYPLNTYLPKYGISTPLRITHFLAQVGHETLSFLYYKELASGSAYEGRKDLGNVEVGDGVKFKGRGAIQITGRANYAKVSKFIFNDDRLLKNPELLELPNYGILAACWFWTTHNLNSFADKDDILSITRRINGGTNGLEDRKERLIRAKKALLI